MRPQNVSVASGNSENKVLEFSTFELNGGGVLEACGTSRFPSSISVICQFSLHYLKRVVVGKICYNGECLHCD